MFDEPEKSAKLYAFERKVHELITSNGVSPIVFFRKFGSMATGLWVNAHFRIGQGRTPEQGATEWFEECVKPKIKKLKKTATPWRRVSTGHYTKLVAGKTLEIIHEPTKRVPSEREWITYLDGKLVQFAGYHHGTQTLDDAKKDAERIGPCRDCGEIKPSYTRQERCLACERQYDEDRRAYREGNAAAKWVEAWWPIVEALQRAGSVEEGIEILRGYVPNGMRFLQ